MGLLLLYGFEVVSQAGVAIFWTVCPTHNGPPTPRILSLHLSISPTQPWLACAALCFMLHGLHIACLTHLLSRCLAQTVTRTSLVLTLRQGHTPHSPAHGTAAAFLPAIHKQ